MTVLSGARAGSACHRVVRAIHVVDHEVPGGRGGTGAAAQGRGVDDRLPEPDVASAHAVRNAGAVRGEELEADRSTDRPRRLAAVVVRAWVDVRGAGRARQ